MSEKEEIKKALEKGSFPLEIQCTSTLWQRGWHTYNQFNYLDPKTQTLRAIDIYAMYVKVLILGSMPFTVKMKLAIECKKSQKAWVFYTVDSKLWDSTDQLIEECLKSLLTYKFKPKRSKAKLLEFKTHFSQHTLRGLIPTEPYNHGSNRHIFEAANQCVKAACDIFKTTRTIDFERQHESREALIVYPVIVLDGKLFSASRGLSGDLAIEEKDWVVYDWAMTFGTERLPTTHILVDIVTERYFAKYIASLEEECASAKLDS